MGTEDIAKFCRDANLTTPYIFTEVSQCVALGSLELSVGLELTEIHPSLNAGNKDMPQRCTLMF